MPRRSRRLPSNLRFVDPILMVCRQSSGHFVPRRRPMARKHPSHEPCSRTLDPNRPRQYTAATMMYRNRLITVSRVKTVIAKLAEQGHPSIRSVADYLDLSTRSFQRQLKVQGCTFSDLVEQTRYETALSLLRDTSLNVAEVAALLGYRDPSSFSRAFARWAGCSPMQFRKASRHSGRTGSEVGTKWPDRLNGRA